MNFNRDNEIKNENKSIQNDFSDKQETKSNDILNFEKLEPKIIIPEDEILKTIIMNMAQYVARNGIEFESNIKKRNEERFSFLNEENIHYSFYKSKIKEIIDNVR